MALSWSAQQVAGVRFLLSEGAFPASVGANCNSGRHQGLLVPPCAQSGPVELRRLHSQGHRTREPQRGVECRQKAAGRTLVSFELQNAQNGGQESATASISPTSSYNVGPTTSLPSSTPQNSRALHKLAQSALRAIPLLLLFAVCSGPAFAVEPPPPPETLNTIIVPPGGGHLSLGQRIAVALRSLGLPDWVTIILVAALPVVELRGAIPVGYWLGLKPIHVFGLAVLGNMLPIPFLIAYIGQVSDWLVKRSGLAKKFFDWLFARTRSRADLLVKYRTLGLTLFVAVPLPLTGAWSGAIGAYLLGLPFWESIAANLAGVVIAGAIVTVLCELGWVGAVVAGVGLFAAAIAAFWTSRRKEEAGEEPVV